MEKRIFKVPSTDASHTLHGVIYLPREAPRGYFHIVHGMTEHIGRYDRLMTDLAEAGYIAFGYDHLGHGYTARDKSELGFIAAKGGDTLLPRDVKAYSDAVFAEYEPIYGKLPYYLMGHSMGSFVTRLAVERHVRPDRYIIMGTGGKNPAAGPGLCLIALIKAFKGPRHISPLIDKLAFGSYNKKFGGGNEADPSPWLTTDNTVRKQYWEDDFCSFKFTVSAMGDLIRMMKDCNRAAWFKRLPKDLPILLVSGADDPVGDYGKGVKQVHTSLETQGMNATCILYEGARHEILNDRTYETVKNDMLHFIES